MFGTIRKHSTWLWVIIITGIIISFVVYFTPNSMKQGGGGDVTVTIDGRNFSRDQINAADREMRVGTALGFRTAGQSALDWLLITVKLEQYGISVGPEATAAWIRDRIMTEGGPFAGMTFEQVAQRLGLSAEDLTRFARHQAGFEVLIETLGGAAALVTPQEIEAAYRRDNEKLEVEVAFVANSNYVAKVVMDPAEVTKFYSNRVAAYRSPDLVQVRYVRFATSNYLARAEAKLNTDAGLDNRVTQSYLQRTNSFAGVEEAEAKRQVRQEMIDDEAFQLAKREVYDFINRYYDNPFDGGPAKAAELMAGHAKTLGLELKSTNPFPRDGLPEGLAVGPEFVNAAFSLKPEEPFSTAVTAPDGYYALCYEQRIPGTVEPLEKVKEKVEKEFRLDAARKLAREAADAFYQAATNAVAGGQSFSALAENSGFAVTKIPALTLRTTDLPGVTLPADIHTISAIANNQETNSVSRPQFAADGLLVLRTGARTPPEALEMQMGLAEYRASVRRVRENEVLNEWFAKQRELSGVQNILRNSAQ